MPESVEFVLTNPSIAALNCVEALKAAGVPIEFETLTFAAIAEELIQMERSGALIFTDKLAMRRDQ